MTLELPAYQGPISSNMNRARAIVDQQAEIDAIERALARVQDKPAPSQPSALKSAQLLAYGLFKNGGMTISDVPTCREAIRAARAEIKEWAKGMLIEAAYKRYDERFIRALIAELERAERT